MAFTDLTPLPTAPARTMTPDEFIAAADAWVGALGQFVTQMNTFQSELEAAAALIAAAPAYADPGLVALTGNAPAADRVPYYTGTGTSALATLTAAGRALLDDADVAAQRTTLGLGALALLSSINNGNWSGTALALANGGTGATDAPTARTNLGLGAAATQALTAFLQPANNLSDVANAATARSNLGALAVPTISGGATSGKIALGPLTLAWRDHAFTNSGNYAYGDAHTYSSWARAWVEGDDTGGTDTSIYVTAAGLSSASVTNGGTGSPSSYNVLFSIGV